MKTFFYFVPNLYLNLVLVFFISYFLVELIIKLFKIKSPIWQYSFRILPYLKLIVDPFQYNFKHWAYAQKIPILNLDPGTRNLEAAVTLNLKGISYRVNFSIENNLFGFGALDAVFEKWGIAIAYIITSGILIFSIFKTICWIHNLYKESHNKNQTLKKLPIKALSTSLRLKLRKGNIRVFITDTINASPYVQFLNKKQIIFPQNVYDALTTNEIEAVILHELAHLKPCHLTFFIFLHFIKNFFFFIPIKKIHHSLEKLCDTFALTSNKEPSYLMQAIAKSAHICAHKKKTLPQFNGFSKLADRIETLAHYKSYQYSKLKITLLSILFALTISLIFQSHLGHF
ncbi:MAG: hypothetical protein S4CHLAM6_14040 [Chlamydiae bacterium]|nr:hypothetical protein [Chlamydiota bacterium]